MYEYDEECLKTFLENQSQLFDEPVAESMAEAEAFLEDCMAAVVDSIDEVREFLDGEGLDVGDSEVDITTGNNAGVKTIGVTWGFRTREELEASGAEIMIDSPMELLEFV